MTPESLAPLVLFVPDEYALFVMLHPALFHTRLPEHSCLWCRMQAAEAAKEEAEQRFWLPLERSKGRQMGELCVSLLLTKVGLISITCAEVHDSSAQILAHTVLSYNRAWPALCAPRLISNTRSCGSPDIGHYI